MLLGLGTKLAERGLLPLFVLRAGVRSIVRARFRELSRNDGARREHMERFVAELRQSPLALVPELANEQHYEVPAALFEVALGKHLKYSSCFFPKPTTTLDEAEAAMLALTCERAGLRDGMQILELGCGWGSLSLWMAEHYPNSRITALSNSASQRQFIMKRAGERGLKNLSVITCDINEFSIDQRFDRIVSVEMFEHLRNYEKLFESIRGWLNDDGRLFVHIFCHRHTAYPYETEGEDNWMGRYFFSGGIMPSEDLFSHFSRHLRVEQLWRVNGSHYQRTAMWWRLNIERESARVVKICEAIYGPGQGRMWFERWRLFFLACEELFGFRGGEEWYVSHYLFSPSEGTA